MSGVKMTWSMLFSIKLRQADHLLKWILEQPFKDDYTRNNYRALLACVKGVADFNQNLIPITVSIPKTQGMISELLSNVRDINTFEALKNSVLDQRFASQTNLGYITLYAGSEKEVKLLIPPLLGEIYITHEHMYIALEAASKINNLVGLSTIWSQMSEQHPQRESVEASIEREKEAYVNKLLNLLGNSVRQLSSPAVGNSLYAKVTSNPDLSYGQIGIPEHAFKVFKRRSKQFAETHQCLVFRQPVHTDCELVSMTAIPVKGSTIQINPAMVTLFRGDFDGDPFYVVVPDEPLAYADLDKLRIEKVLETDIYWQPSNLFKKISEIYEIDGGDSPKWEVESETLLSDETEGITSYPENMNFESSSSEWQHMWNNPLTAEWIDSNSMEAGISMGMVKHQTALCGGMALQFLLWCHFKNHNTRLGLEMYRLAAEDSLKNKSGHGAISKNLAEMWTSSRTTIDGPSYPSKIELEYSMTKLMEANSNETFMSMFKKDLVELFYQFLLDKAQYYSSQQFLVSISPLAAIVRGVDDTAVYRKYLETGCPQNLFAQAP